MHVKNVTHAIAICAERDVAQIVVPKKEQKLGWHMRNNFNQG